MSAGIKKAISITFNDERSSGVRAAPLDDGARRQFFAMFIRPAGWKRRGLGFRGPDRMDRLLKAHISLAAPSPLGCVVHRLNGGVKPVPIAPFRQDWQGVVVAGGLSGAE